MRLKVPWHTYLEHVKTSICDKLYLYCLIDPTPSELFLETYGRTIYTCDPSCTSPFPSLLITLVASVCGMDCDGYDVRINWYNSSNLIEAVFETLGIIEAVSTCTQ